MNRHLARLILVLLLAAAAWMLRSHWWQHLDQLADAFPQAHPSRPFRSSQSYPLSDDQWLTFDLPSRIPTLRILSTANFSADAIPVPPAPPARPGWGYALHYQLLDARDRVLDQGSYHFRTRLPEYVEPTVGRYRPCFYASEPLLAGQTCRLQYPLESRAAGAVRLRLRSAGLDPQIVDVAVRVYGRETQPEYKLDRLWRRISKPQRERLCRASVYAPELLGDVERRNLMRWRWLALAPRGVEGSDYRRRILYSWENITGNRVGDEVPPEGLLVEPEGRGVLALPEGAAAVQLQVEPAGESSPATVEVRWFGRGLHQRQTHRLHVAQGIHTAELAVGGGLLVFDATASVVVRARARVQDEWRDVDSRPHYLRGYLTDRQRPVEYHVTHAAGRPTPLRVSLRCFGDHGEGPADVEVEWTFFDATEQTVLDGRLVVDQPWSDYDRAGGFASSQQVSEAADYCFLVPEQVQRVRFRSLSRHVLVAAYTRPADMDRVTHVPDDYFAFRRLHQAVARSWFGIRPLNHYRLLDQNRTVGLSIAPRPPDDAEDLLAGRYTWDDYHPRGLWKARLLLAPGDDQPGSPRAASVTFRELAPHEEHHLQLLPSSGHRWVQPQLIYCAQGELPQTLRVFVNGKLHQRAELRAYCGEIDLLTLPPGTAAQGLSLSLDAPGGTRFFLSNVIPGAGPMFRKRLAHKISRTSLTFPYRKQSSDEELFVLRVFQPPEEVERRQLRVRVRPPTTLGVGPHPALTILKRVYDLRPCGPPSSLVLSSGQRMVGAGQPCILLLGSDLPPGEYLLDVDWQSDHEGYLAISRTTPGLAAQRQLFRETPAGVN